VPVLILILFDYFFLKRVRVELGECWKRKRN